MPHNVIERIKNILIVLLTLTMLLLAGIYIGFSQFGGTTTALRRTELPGGTVPAGSTAPRTPADYELGLLTVRAASVTVNGKTVGTFGGTAANGILTSVMPAVHACLSAEASLSFISEEDYFSACEGDGVCLLLPGALPYQILYAMTGEVDAAAGFSAAVRADALFLTADADGKTLLYLSDGKVFLSAVCDVPFKKAELLALAENTALSQGVLLYGRILVCDRAFVLPSVRFTSGRAFTDAEYDALLYSFGYNPDRHRAILENGGEGLSFVEPHGTLEITADTVRYEAAMDGGIPLSAFTGDAKDALDVDLYDVLSAAIRFTDGLRKIAPACFGGSARPYLRSFYRDGDGYTVLFGYAVEGAEILGEDAPFFVKLTVRGANVETAEIRRLCAEKTAHTLTLFPAAWEYAYAAKEEIPASFRLCYLPKTADEGETDAGYYCTYFN